MSAEHDRTERQRNDRIEHGPAEEKEGGTIGNTSERSSENRREGLERDRERANHPNEVSDSEEAGEDS